MRDILFRGKGISCPNEGKWLYGYYTLERSAYSDNSNDLNHYIRERCGINNRVDPATVGQFTGLYVKNDKPVFDGDILQFGERRLVVWWNDEAFQWQAKTVSRREIVTYNPYMSRDYNKNWNNIELGAIAFLGDTTYIIGNIYDNPELIQ